MKFALHFCNLACPDPASARRLAVAAETAGFETLICVEHVVWPTDYQSTYPYAEGGKLPGGSDTVLPDPLIWMAWAAGQTERLRFMTGILILPQRNPVVLAKEVASLDYLSGGRIHLGIGAGWLEEEFDAIGVPFARRGARMDDYIGAMRTLWGGDDVSYDGEFVQFARMNCNPKPHHGAVPIVIGGHSQAAARRAGRLGDGFFPATGSPVDIVPIIDLMRRTAEEAGRDPAAVELTTGCPEALAASTEQRLEAVAAARARGVDRIALPVMAFMPALEEELAAYGESVIRRVSG